MEPKIPAKKQSGVFSIRHPELGVCYVASASDLLNAMYKQKAGLEANRHGSFHLQTSWNNRNGEGFYLNIEEVVEDWSPAVRKEKKDFWVKKLDPRFNVYQILRFREGSKWAPLEKAIWSAAEKAGKDHLLAPVYGYNGRQHYLWDVPARSLSEFHVTHEQVVSSQPHRDQYLKVRESKEGPAEYIRKKDKKVLHLWKI